MFSDLKCFYCGGKEGRRCTTLLPAASARSVTHCKSCGRILEEHKCDVQELFTERARDIPLCVVTPDFSDTNEQYRTPPLEDDPFESIGFITTFSTWSLELSPLFATTTSSFCGYLAELERVLLDNTTEASESHSSGPGGGNVSLVDNLRAYFQIMEVCSLLGLDRDISDHAVQLFRDCSSAAYMRNRNIEALATAALVQASREAKEVRTLQEISVAAGVPQKEIHRYMKILTDSLNSSQPINSNSISVYMPRFCSILELEKATQDVATHIGEVVMDKSFCTRRNPISISAAAIYLSCQLEDKKKTQTEICKATALTEVTLRKVYKELLEHLNDLLPTGYTPVIPPERAFAVNGPSLNRVGASRSTASTGLNLNIPSIPELGTQKSEGTLGCFSSSTMQSCRGALAVDRSHEVVQEEKMTIETQSTSVEAVKRVAYSQANDYPFNAFQASLEVVSSAPQTKPSHNDYLPEESMLTPESLHPSSQRNILLATEKDPPVMEENTKLTLGEDLGLNKYSLGGLSFSAASASHSTPALGASQRLQDSKMPQDKNDDFLGISSLEAAGFSSQNTGQQTFSWHSATPKLFLQSMVLGDASVNESEAREGLPVRYVPGESGSGVPFTMDSLPKSGISYDGGNQVFNSTTDAVSHKSENRKSMWEK